MTHRRLACSVLAVFATAATAWGDAPVASYIFPAGGQRGTTVPVRVGGLNLHKGCGFAMLGRGVLASKQLRGIPTIWFEGPLLPLPDSQRQEDYPKDFAGEVRIAADAPLGVRPWQLWTAQGATKSMLFLVGDLPEVIEEEIAGDPVPVALKLPVTVNGRIFPREDVDVWTIDLKKGQPLSCEVHATRLGSPLEARLEVLDPQGRRLAENDTFGADPFVRVLAPTDGKYQVRIHDVNFRGGPAYVYRLTLTSGPHVDRVYPLGGQRGSKAKFAVYGQGLPGDPVEIALPAAGPRDLPQRLTVGGLLTNEFLLDLDDLPEHVGPVAGESVPLPAVVNGRIGKPGQADDWPVELRKGETYEVELRAAVLGSPLHGVLTVLDASGKELTRSEAPAPGRADPALRFTAPADGTYTLRVQDRFRSRGGPAFAYRLRLAPPGPADFRLRLAVDALSLNRGGQAKLTIQAERLGGFAVPIALSVEGLPPGVTVKNTQVAARQNAAVLAFTAEAKAPIRAGRLTVRGTALVGKAMVTRLASLPVARGAPDLDNVLLAVALPTPFKIVGEYDMRWAARGTVHERRYKIERNGFDGPIEISLADKQARHLQGVTGPTLTVPAGVSAFSYPVTLPPWMETGRTCRVCVMGAAVVKDDSGEHVVTFTSTAPNEQLIAVVEPGRLGVELERGSLAARPGKTATVLVRVLRGKGLSGPAKVELLVPGHVRGVTAPALTIPAGADRAELTLRFSDPLPGPFNMPLTVRATVPERGNPVIGEAKVEIVPER